MNKFIKENLDVKVAAKNVYKLKIKENKEIVVAELDSWDQKREVMSKKKNLKTGIWIEDGLTKEEREIQKQLREKAKEERTKGKKVKVGYMKIFIEDCVYIWNEKDRRLEEKSRRNWEEEGKETVKEGLKICFWNIAGIINKCDETWEYLDIFDIIGLIETWIEEKEWKKIKNKMSNKFNWICTPARKENKKGREWEEELLQLQGNVWKR